MPTIYIDNKAYEVKAGKNLLEACLSLGFDLPYFCWHPALGSIGACRQCAVKSFRNEEDKRGRLVMACMEPVANDMRISINDVDAREFRKHVVEWLMTNHPHDCAVCDEGGSCHLQDMTVMTGHDYRRFSFMKRTYQNQYLGPFLNHEMNRCIQCYRCVRFYKDYAGGNDLDVFASKNHVYFGRHEDGVLENEFSGNLAEVCPTGVFTDKTLKRHYTRKWDLTTAPSVCHHCSIGCNTLAGERYGTLRTILNRYHGDINGYFLCDRGRFGYEFVNAKDRIRKPLLNGHPTTTESALYEAGLILKKEKTIGIGSSRASLESNFALKKLVGDDNFYLGVSEKEYWLNRLAMMIMEQGSVRPFSMKEVENADAVLILGEDLTNTAPMMALAVRQSVRQTPLEDVANARIPTWNDAAAREMIQQDKGPLYIGCVSSTKLDSLARQCFHGSPDDLARIGFAIANLLDADSPSVTGLSPQQQILANEIATALSEAKTPLVISGTSCKSEAVMMASANIAEALYKRSKNAGIVLTLSECNSLGLTLIGGKPLKEAYDFVRNNTGCSAIILENDLYRHGRETEIDELMRGCNNVVVADHSNHRTVRQATLVFPSGSFAEADGTLVNYEGRGQRFFQVYRPSDDIQETWRWIIRMADSVMNDGIRQWKNVDDITRAISNEIPSLKGIERVAPPAEFRINGQKIPRESHRFSGRTAMLANVHVSEPKPPEDIDSALTYTMEGFRGFPPPPLIPFFWAPGWNSVQSTNKYQEEVGGPLRGGNPGVRLVSENGKEQVRYFKFSEEQSGASENAFQLVPLYHIFGSEPLSAIGDAVSQRVPYPYIGMNINDLNRINIEPLSTVEIDVAGKRIDVEVKVIPGLREGLAGLPWGLAALPYFEISEGVQIKGISESLTTRP